VPCWERDNEKSAQSQAATEAAQPRRNSAEGVKGDFETAQTQKWSMGHMKTLDKLMTRDSMPFPFRWYDTLLELPDGELRAMLEAMRNYAEAGTAPTFSGAMAALWREIRDRIDFDRGKYDAICQARSEAGKIGASARWQTMANDGKRILPMANDGKNAEGEGEGEGEGKGEGKESILTDTKENASASASLFSLDGETEPIAKSAMNPGRNFRQWTAEQFKRSVSAAVTEHPEYTDIQEAFTDYWTEPDPKGRPRFRLEKTWDTARRLARWYDNNQPAAGPTAGSRRTDSKRPGRGKAEVWYFENDPPAQGPQWSDHEEGEDVELVF